MALGIKEINFTRGTGRLAVVDSPLDRWRVAARTRRTEQTTGRQAANETFPSFAQWLVGSSLLIVY